MEKTLGQKRVKADFNPDKNGTVDKIKNKAAELIDLIEVAKWEHYEEQGCKPPSSERARVGDIAQQGIETACMYAVKTCFID